MWSSGLSKRLALFRRSMPRVLASEMKIRPLAIALIFHEDRLLVMECFDNVKQEIFYRPLGGGIEFSETGETIRRSEATS